MKKAYILGVILIVAGILVFPYSKVNNFFFPSIQSLQIFFFDRKQKRKRKNLRKKNEIRK